MEILKSASKLVFILLAIGLIVLTFIGKVEAKDFMTALLMAFTFYFANKGNSNEPYAGK